MDKAIDLFDRNNVLLEQILSKLSEKISNKKDYIQEKSNETLKDIPNQKKKEISLEEIEKEELLDWQISKFKKNLKDDELIIQMKRSKEFKIIKKSNYELENDLHLSGRYIVVYKN